MKTSLNILQLSLKKVFLTSLFFLLALSLFAADQFPEKPTTIVSDYTGTLSAEELNSLERKLVAFDDSTSMQIAVVLMKSTGEFDIADYATQLFNKWHIGDKSKNSGVLLLIAKEDRKMFIATGYGMEGVLPDALAKQVVDRTIKPHFIAGDYYGGIDEGTNDIIQIVKGEYQGNRKQGKEKPTSFPFFMFAFIMFVIIVSKIRRTQSYSRKNNLGFWAAWALLNAASSRSRGSWGGFSGGGGFGGGGFGGGGFGGFGGGSSGGGGAGGSW